MKSRQIRISVNMARIIDEEMKRFEKDFGVQLTRLQITEMLASKYGNNPLKNVEIQFKWKGKIKNGIALL